MNLALYHVKLSSPGIWQTEIDPSYLLKLGRPFRQSGRLSVLMVTNPLYDKQTSKLEFDLLSIALLNIGDTAETIIIDSTDSVETQEGGESHSGVAESVISPYPDPIDGDDLYLQHLEGMPTEPLRLLGRELLRRVRQEFPCKLKYYPKSKRHIEQPDNFWTITIQTQKRALKISVYGHPDMHSTCECFKIIEERGYSVFAISDMNQLEDALEMIRRAKHLKDRKRARPESITS